jgi:hypothetical protein
MHRFFAAIVVTLATAAAVLPAQAQTQERQSFRALLAAGYDIKNVSIIPIEVSKRYDDKSSTDTVAITLQRPKSVAVCYLNLSNWINLLSASLEDNTRCDVRTF